MYGGGDILRTVVIWSEAFTDETYSTVIKNVIRAILLLHVVVLRRNTLLIFQDISLLMSAY